VTIRLAFTWQDWPDETPYEQREAIVTDPETGKPMKTPWRPLQTKTEMREVACYDDLNPDYWLLERWAPPSVFGSKEAWYAPERCVNGNPDLPMQGMFPNEGRYIYCMGEFERQPSLGFLADAIAQWNRNKDNMDRDVAKYVARVEYEAGIRYEARRKKALENTEARVRDAMSPILSTSLGAGRWRQQMYERAGFRSHVGN
jgi:hypothetical protein